MSNVANTDDGKNLSAGLVTIGNIKITGNKKTKSNIILREIPFKPEDKLTLSDLVTKFETARKQLMNTSLFLSVIVALADTDGDRVNVSVNVKERWYLFPLLILSR
jgi:outer membrane protein assembly factor BamA